MTTKELTKEEMAQRCPIFGGHFYLIKWRIK